MPRPIHRAYRGYLASCLFVAATPMVFAQPQPPDPQRFESAIREFEAEDDKRAPPPGGILFVGSSSIRMWNLSAAFPGLPVINRGFGGSHLADTTYYADRIVTKYKPRIVVLYAGDNDIAHGLSPETVAGNFAACIQKIREGSPRSKIVFLSIKASRARWKLYPEMQRANALIEKKSAAMQDVTFVDVATPMLGDDGQPREALFVKDGLHLSAAGYKVWKRLVLPHLRLSQSVIP